MGLPPEPEPAVITQVAPEECIAYVSWAGMAKPNPESTNETERLLAEPSVRGFFGSLVEQVSKYAVDNDNSLPAKAMPIGKTFLTRPVAGLQLVPLTGCWILSTAMVLCLPGFWKPMRTLTTFLRQLI